MEREVSPPLPTSGQIFGGLVKNLGISHPLLQSRTARRFFSGRMEQHVKDSTRAEIIGAIAEVLSDIGLADAPGEGDDNPTPGTVLADLLDWHGTNWELWRDFMRPRMMRVLPSNLPAVWAAYLRLGTIDLALRIAGKVHSGGAPPCSLDFLEWASCGRRGRYLNQKRMESGITLFDFAEAVGVTFNAAEAWVYNGTRPSDENLTKVALVLSPANEPSETKRVLQELRRLYWISDIAGLLENFIGPQAVDDILVRLKTYSCQALRIIDERVSEDRLTDIAAELASIGTHCHFAQSLLAELASHESDAGWQEDLKAASGNWIRRILAVNIRVHQAEESELIRESEGRILQDWDVGNPEAYAHYQRSLELQNQGRIYEAVAEVATAAELDPLDPVNHFTLGSAKRAIGLQTGNSALIEEALEASWLAATLDPNWVLPWAEIGLILLGNGKAREAVEHLQAVGPERRLEPHYFNALGASLREVGDYSGSLKAFESSLELNPEDLTIVEAAAMVATWAGENIKSNRYFRMARHMGASEDLGELLKQIRSTRSSTSNIQEGSDEEIAGLDAAIRRNPDSAEAHLRRGRAFFLRGEDERAVNDLDAAVRLNPNDAGIYQFRGIVCAYLGRYDRVVADMSETVRLKPGMAEAHYYRGVAYGEQDKFDLAVADLDEAIRLKPDYTDAYNARGDCHRYRGESDLAIADYDAALLIDPDHGRAHRGRGAAWRSKGQLELAIADYDAAVEINPGDSFAYRFRGDAHLAHGNYVSALSDFDAALALRPDDGVAHRQKGKAHLFREEFDLAMAAFTLAVESNPASGSAFYGRGLAREIMGDAIGAEGDYSRARELGYDDSDSD